MTQDKDAREVLVRQLRVPQMQIDAEKITENRLRSVARRQGYTLVKSKARDRRSLLYGTYGVLRGDRVVAGDPTTNYGLTLGQVEQFLGEVPPESLRTFRALDRAGNVLGQTDAIDGFAAISWAEMAIKRRARPPLSFISIQELCDGQWKFFFESEVAIS